MFLRTAPAEGKGIKLVNTFIPLCSFSDFPGTGVVVYLFRLNVPFIFCCVLSQTAVSGSERRTGNIGAVKVSVARPFPRGREQVMRKSRVQWHRLNLPRFCWRRVSVIQAGGGGQTSLMFTNAPCCKHGEVIGDVGKM